MTSSTRGHWQHHLCVPGLHECFYNGSGLPTPSAPLALSVGEITALAAPNGAGLSQMTSPERELADKESSLSKIRPGFGSLTAARHPDMGRLSTQSLILHRGEGLAVRSTTRLKEAEKEGSSSCLSTGFSWREWAGGRGWGGAGSGRGCWAGGKKGGEGKGTRILLGKSLRIFQQREGSPRCRAAGCRELLMQTLPAMDLFILVWESP